MILFLDLWQQLLTKGCINLGYKYWSTLKVEKHMKKEIHDKRKRQALHLQIKRRNLRRVWAYIGTFILFFTKKVYLIVVIFLCIRFVWLIGGPILKYSWAATYTLGHLELYDQLVGFMISKLSVIDRPNKRKKFKISSARGAHG